MNSIDQFIAQYAYDRQRNASSASGWLTLHWGGNLNIYITGTAYTGTTLIIFDFCLTGGFLG